MLFIRSIIEENLVNNESNEVESNCSELPQVKEAVDRLNGIDKTAVILKRDGQNFMVIGGGANGVFVVTAQVNGKAYAMANKFPIPKDNVKVTIGGKSGFYPSKKCVSLSMALEAAKHFASRGALAQTFTWEF